MIEYSFTGPSLRIVLGAVSDYLQMIREPLVVTQLLATYHDGNWTVTIMVHNPVVTIG